MAIIGWKPSTKPKDNQDDQKNKKITKEKKYIEEHESNDGQHQRAKRQRKFLEGNHTGKQTNGFDDNGDSM